jgi:hypothetical protein
MKRRHVIIGLAVALLAGCSDSKLSPDGSGPDARPTANDAAGGRGGSGAGGGMGAGGAGTGGAAGGTGGRGADAGGVDAPAGGTGDARSDAAGRADGGGIADAPVGATDSGPPDGRRASDVRSSDARFRYPDPAGQLCGHSQHTLAKSRRRCWWCSIVRARWRSSRCRRHQVGRRERRRQAGDGGEPQHAWASSCSPRLDVECGLGPAWSADPVGAAASWPR